MNLSKKTILLSFCILFPIFLISFVFVIKLYNLTGNVLLLDLALILNLIILSFFLALIVSIILWWIFSLSIINPIKEINQIAKIITSGNLGTRITNIGKDEIGELGRNINSIINSLTKSVQSMANSLRDEKLKEAQLQTSYTQLKQLQAKDEALLKNLGEGVIAIDQNSVIFLFNDAAAMLTGFSVGEVLGKKYSQFLKFEFEKKTEPVPDFIDSCLKQQPVKELLHLQLITKYDQRIPVTQITTSITDVNKKNYGALVVLRNITRERQLDRLKDEFVSIASHELRTPMTAIRGLISMIFEGDYGEVNQQIKEPLSDIASSTQRLIELVNDMLDVSRIEGGRIKYDLADLKISDEVKEIVNLMQPIAAEKGVQLIFSQAGGQEIIQTDPSKFKQILSNLVGNSLKFTDKGTIEIKYVIHNDLSIVSVRDSGIGINPLDQKKLFSKFSQVTSSQLGRPVGTGLGLYISREFARKMGGDLWIANSQVGVGSVFSFSIPLANTPLANHVKHNIMNKV